MQKKIEPKFKAIDTLIVSNEWSEWNHVRYLIEEWFKDLEAVDTANFIKQIGPDFPPFFPYFENQIKRKLIEAGFKKEIIDNPKRFKKVLNGLDNQGKTIYGARDGVWKYPPFAYGYPAEVVEWHDDKSMYWINPDIEGALRALESITIMKGLLVNKEAVKVYLRSFELIINLARSGHIPEMIKAEVDRQENRKKKMESIDAIIYLAIKNVLEKAPTPKQWTLGYVMLKLDYMNKNKVLYDCATVKVGEKDGKNGVYILKLDKKVIWHFKERSLQRFINEYKRVHFKKKNFHE